MFRIPTLSIASLLLHRSYREWSRRPSEATSAAFTIVVYLGLSLTLTASHSSAADDPRKEEIIGDSEGQGDEAHPSRHLRVVSFNVRYGTADDGENRWEVRKSLVVEAIRTMKPDIMGTQEIQAFQAEYLQASLPEFGYLGKPREPGQDDGEQCGIFFRRDRFNDVEQGHFWLSETPDVPGSKSWDSSLPRMATWAKFYDVVRQERFVVINTHFDHRGAQARLEGARLLRRRALELSDGLPVVITGDFNSGEASGPYRALVGEPNSGNDATFSFVDTYRVAHPEEGENEGTFNGFRGRRAGPRIDWIMVGPSIEVEDAQIVAFEKSGRYPSDHFPIAATLDWDVAGDQETRD